MPIIFTRPAAGGGTITKELGAPSDGTFTDGLLELTPNMLTADAVDEINEVLLDLAPAQPQTLSGTSLISNRSFVIGKIPSGLGSNWYVNTSAGETVNFILEYDNIELSSADPSDRFNKGNEGFLVVESSVSGSNLVEVATLDIEANFDSSVVGPATQDLTTWDNQGSGDPCIDATVTFSGGSLEVTYCGWHNNFDRWQRMNAKINVTSLKEGYNSYRLVHKLNSGSDKTFITQIWYDNDTNALSFSSSPDLVENSLVSNKYLSGIRYYSLNDTFDISYTAENIYRKCYHPTHVSTYRFDGQNNEVVINPSSTPHYTDNLTVNQTITIDRTNFYTVDGRLNVSLYHPWKITLTQSSPSHNILICTYSGVSTDTHEYFLDEYYRLPIGSYDTIPANITNQWNSQASLTNGNALVFNQRVQYPTQDFSSFWPAGNPDYSSFTGAQLYVRAFSDSDPHSNVILTLEGLDLNNIASFGSGDINIAVKLPTQTGWLDAGRFYNAGDFSGSDGDGCLVSKAGQELHLTFGTFSTANSGYLIVVEIRFLNANNYITEMYVNW